MDLNLLYHKEMLELIDGQEFPRTSSLIEHENYRFGVVGVFTNNDGSILVCERANMPGVWQFPQGGIDDGETADEAIRREVLEELGTGDFRVIYKADKITTYQFPKDATFELAKKFIGQKHYWYHLQFNIDARPDLTKSDGEFVDIKWVPISSALDSVVSWKWNAYVEGLRLLKIGGF